MTSSETKEECAICLDEMEAQACGTLPCNHRFHFACIVDRTKTGATCPLCNKPFRTIRSARGVVATIADETENRKRREANHNKIVADQQRCLTSYRVSPPVRPSVAPVTRTRSLTTTTTTSSNSTPKRTTRYDNQRTQRPLTPTEEVCVVICLSSMLCLLLGGLYWAIPTRSLEIDMGSHYKCDDEEVASGRVCVDHCPCTVDVCMPPVVFYTPAPHWRAPGDDDVDHCCITQAELDYIFGL